MGGGALPKFRVPPIGRGKFEKLPYVAIKESAALRRTLLASLGRDAFRRFPHCFLTDLVPV